MTTAQVYINHGRFVAECRCGDGRELQVGQRQMTCIDGHVTDLEWPSDAPQLMAALSERLSAKRRNWFPPGHPAALAGNFPQGQTPDELRAETAAGEEADAAALAEKRAALLAQLRDLGVTQDEALAVLKGV